MDNLGFKKLTVDNWLEKDTTLSGFVRLSHDGQVHAKSGQDWMRSIFEPKLKENVPLEVHALFEVARGTAVYGCFFYPLYMLAIEQLHRVAEAAIRHKCKRMEPARFAKNFAKNLSWLKKNGVLTEEEYLKWDNTRELRNMSSHPENQMALPPNYTISTLRSVANDINSLFMFSKDALSESSVT